jgi:hypothetical protein
MPFQSQQQRAYLHDNQPAIAKKWEREEAQASLPQRGQRAEINKQKQQAQLIRAANAK